MSWNTLQKFISLSLNCVSSVSCEEFDQIHLDANFVQEYFLLSLKVAQLLHIHYLNYLPVNCDLLCHHVWNGEITNHQLKTNCDGPGFRLRFSTPYVLLMCGLYCPIVYANVFTNQGAHSPDARSVSMGVFPIQAIKSQILESDDVSPVKWLFMDLFNLVEL